MAYKLLPLNNMVKLARSTIGLEYWYMNVYMYWPRGVSNFNWAVHLD